MHSGRFVVRNYAYLLTLYRHTRFFGALNFVASVVRASEFFPVRHVGVTDNNKRTARELSAFPEYFWYFSFSYCPCKFCPCLGNRVRAGSVQLLG